MTFGQDENTVHLLRRGSDAVTVVGPAPKGVVADAVWDAVLELWGTGLRRSGRAGLCRPVGAGKDIPMSTEDRRAAHRPGGAGGTDHVEDGGDAGLLGPRGRAPRVPTPSAHVRLGRRRRRTEQAEHGGREGRGRVPGLADRQTGTAVVLTSLLALAATAVGSRRGRPSRTPRHRVREDPGAGAVASAVVVAVVLGVSFWCGGYAAGRMARFDGTRQGLAVWLWALLVTVLIAASRPAGEEYDVLAALDGCPGCPRSGTASRPGARRRGRRRGDLPGRGALGGRAGMRYHRMVDRSRVGY